MARLKLEPFLPGDIEDVALEALEELVEKVHEIKSVDELKPLTASIAHNRTVSRLRKHFAKKRGAGQIESIEARQRSEADCPESMGLDSPLASRGTGPNDAAALHRAWPGATMQSFASPTDLESWERAWPKSDRQAIAKIIYDRSAGEVRVSGHSRGKLFQRTITVDQKLEDALLQAQRFVREQTGN